MKFHETLSFKLHLIFLGIISLSVGITAYLFLKEEEKNFLFMVTENSKALCKNLARDASYGVWAMDTPDLEIYAKGVLNAGNVVFVFLEDKSGNILLSKFKHSHVFKDLENGMRQIRESSATAQKQSPVLIGYEGKKLLHFFEPIEVLEATLFSESANPGRQSMIALGFAHVCVSLEGMETFLKESTKRAFLLSVALFLIFYLLAILFSKTLVNPILALVQASKKLGSGELELQLPQKPKNEMGLLFDSFEEMVKNLREKRDLEHQLLSMDKVASLGRIAGGLAHEFNNILAAISSEAEAGLDVKTVEYSEESLRNILEAAQTGKTITRNLLDFAKPGIASPEKTDVGELLQKTLHLMKREFQNFGIRVEYSSLVPVFCVVDPHQMQQVFLNLLTNARDAMRNGGTLFLEVLEKNPFAEILFRDNGCGISNENLSKVFLPFFTTKGAHEKKEIAGTGLGLSVSKQIVERHGGDIAIQSEAGRGSEVLIHLPLSRS